jgi:hypothetical protein
MKPSALPTSDPHHDHTEYRLAVNSFDRVSSLLVALLFMIGAAVLGLVIVYFARTFSTKQVAIPVQPVVASRPSDAALGLKRDLEPPGIEEAPELSEPQLPETLSAIANAVANRAALISNENFDSAAEAGRGKGLGDERMPGVGGEGDYLREPQREIQFDPQSIEEYARWLDFFRIELGVLGRDNKVHYAYNFTRGRPQTREGAPLEEQRLYLNSSGTPLALLDQRLARDAGIARLGRIILQFFPPESAGILFALEQQAAGNRSLEEVRKTIFRVVRKGNDFEFSVEKQEYR